MMRYTISSLEIVSKLHSNGKPLMWYGLVGGQVEEFVV